VVEEVGHLEEDVVGGWEQDFLAIPLMPQPTHNILEPILKPILSPRLRRRRSSCRMSLLP